MGSLSEEENLIFKLFHLEPGVKKDALHLETLQLLEGVAVVVHMSRERETEAHGAARSSPWAG